MEKYNYTNKLKVYCGECGKEVYYDILNMYGYKYINNRTKKVKYFCCYKCYNAYLKKLEQEFYKKNKKYFEVECEI